MTIDLDQLQGEIEVHLEQIEKLLPTTYKLTLLARCVREDLADADILLTLDTLPSIYTAIQKRIAAEK